MQIDIIGAGALGMLYGGKLAAAGGKIRFWTRTAEQAKHMRKGGFFIQSPDEGQQHIRPEQFSVYPIESIINKQVNRKAEWVFFTTKQRNIDSTLLRNIANLLETKTNIACFQNGIGHIEMIQAAYAQHSVYAVITTEGSKRLAADKIARAGKGETKIGIPSLISPDVANRVMKQKPIRDNEGESLVNRFEEAGFPAFLSNEIDKDIYGKLLINAVINPLTALLRIPNGQLLEIKECRELMRQLCDEGEFVYEACGIPFERNVYDRIAAVCESTSSNTSSMLKDVLEGVPTEIDYINGRLVELAERAKVRVPGHEMIWRLVKSLHDY